MIRRTDLSRRKPHRFQPGAATRVAVALFAVIAAGGVVAADTTIFLVAAGEPDPAAAAYQRVVHDTIQVVLERRGFTVVGSDGGDPDRGPDRDPGGGANQLIYRYRVVGFLPRLHLSVEVIDPIPGTRITGAVATARGNLTLYNAVDQLLERLDPAVERYRALTGEIGPYPIPLLADFVLPHASADGSATPEGFHFFDRWSGAPVADGYAVARGARIPLRVERTGYYPGELVLVIPSEPGSHLEPGAVLESNTDPGPATDPNPEAIISTVALRRRRPYGVQLHYGLPRLLGAGVGGRWYLDPDRSYLGAELGITMSGFFEVTPSQILHLDTRLIAGVAPWGRQDRLIQPVFSTGVGIIGSFVTYGSGEPVPPYIDWYWNLLNLGTEIGRGSVRWYVRAGLSYYVETSRGLWLEGLNAERIAPEVVTGTVLRW